MSLLTDIESFIACLDMTVSEFETEAKTPGLVSRLKRDAQPRAATEQRARSFMESVIADAAEHFEPPKNSGAAAYN